MKPLVFTLANHPAAIEPLSRRIRNLAEDCGVPSSVIAKVEVVLDELLDNIISYAYCDEAEHEISVGVAIGAHELALTIRDDGVPFDPSEHAAPVAMASIEDRKAGGLGIHLVRRLMNDVRYEREGGENVVTVVKRFDGSGG